MYFMYNDMYPFAMCCAPVFKQCVCMQLRFLNDGLNERVCQLLYWYSSTILASHQD